MTSKGIGLLIFLFSTSALAAWNNPHIVAPNSNVYHTAFTGAPKTLDPARAYSSDEIAIIGQIYEPPLQYDFLKRPYQLTPLTATALPTVSYQKNDTVYTIAIRPGIYYQSHPCFVPSNLNLSAQQLNSINVISDFKQTATQELTADDYVYEIKRLASPKVSSPIFGFMSDQIVGMKEFSKQVSDYIKQHPDQGFIDLRQFDLSGVKIIDRYHYQITIKAKYPQFQYWLAMNFFAPIPWQADAFYSQPGLQDKNITLNWYPVGTGPYMLVENNPNKQMVLLKNPHFHQEFYPGSKDRLPFINKIIFSLDKENIPRWNKFLQGYYDKAGVASDSFDQAIRLDSKGQPELTQEMRDKGITLQTEIEPTVFYVGFNMLDPIVGGYSEKQKKLRQAISIAFDYEEFISIFLNGRGVAAMGPIPPGIFGYESGEKGINPDVYNWVNGSAQRKSLDEAKKLLAQAGYPNGIDPKTGKRLVLNYDVSMSGGPDDKANFDWLREQFAKLGIELNIRATLYNRFQDAVRTGKAQIFAWGWHADYPDPENFLFLLYGPNGKAEHGGENASNYENKQVDRLFEEIRLLPNGPLRQAKIDALVKIARDDAPWIWGFNPIQFTLSQPWNSPRPAHAVASNTLKYQKINPQLRDELRAKWNNPVLWPLVALGLFLLAIFVPLIITYRRRENRPNVKRIK